MPFNNACFKLFCINFIYRCQASMALDYQDDCLAIFLKSAAMMGCLDPEVEEPMRMFTLVVNVQKQNICIGSIKYQLSQEIDESFRYLSGYDNSHNIIMLSTIKQQRSTPLIWGSRLQPDVELELTTPSNTSPQLYQLSQPGRPWS